MTDFEALIAEFSEKSGLNLEVSKDDSVDIEADGVYVTLQFRENRGDIAMFTLPLFDHQADEPMMRKALEISAYGRGTDGFFLGMEDGSFVLSAVRRLEGYGAEALATDMLAISRATKRIAQVLTLADAGMSEEDLAAAREPEQQPEEPEETCNFGALRV